MKRDLIAASKRRMATGRGRTRGIDARRAISDVYYALFHALAEMCADEMIGPSRRWTDAWVRVYRSLDHVAAKRSLQKAARGPHLEITAFSSVFSSLQELRHDADYNPRPFKLRRDDILTLVHSAEEVIDMIEGFEPVQRQKLAAEILFKDRS